MAMETLEGDDEECRTCLRKRAGPSSSSSPAVPVSLTPIDSRVVALLYQITTLQVSPEDGFPQSICSACLEEVHRLDVFTTACRNSISILKERLKAQCDLVPKEEPFDQQDHISSTGDVQFQSITSKIEDEASDDDHKFEAMPQEDDASENNDDAEVSDVKTIFSCPYCKGPFFLTKIFRKHIETMHPEKKTDDYQSLVWNTPPLGFVYKINGDEYEYRCSCTKYKSTLYSDLTKHFKSHYGDKPVVCSFCDFRCATVHHLKNHIKKHSSDRPFACKLCNYASKKKTGLRVHMMSHSDEKNFRCEFCPCIFKCYTGLKRHISAVHEKRRDRECSICGKKFFKNTDLKMHMKVHTKEKNAICQHCGQGFSQVSNLRTHIKAMHEIDEVARRFKCDICGFTSKHNLHRHMMKHAGIKNHKCDQCPFITNSSYTLKIHMLRHAGETRFSCDLCDYKCLEKGNLVIHQVTHTGEKNFSCDLCPYAGATQSALKRHRETHSSELKYSCPHCPYKTNVRDILTTHIRKKCPAKREEIKTQDKEIIPSAYTPIVFKNKN